MIKRKINIYIYENVKDTRNIYRITNIFNKHLLINQESIIY